MLCFKEVMLFCFVIEIDKKNSYVALFWHCQAFDLVLRAACNVIWGQHRVIHMSHSLPWYYPSWILVGLVFSFILGCSLTKQNVLLLYHLHICFSFLSFTFCHLKREIFSKPLCLISYQYHRKAKTLGPTKFCSAAPSLGSLLDQSGSSALGRVTQSEHSRDSCPRSPYSSYCRHWWCPWRTHIEPFME